MNYRNRIAALLLCLSLLCALPVAASAVETLDEGQKGTITVEMRYGGKAVTGGALTAYRVGAAEEIGGDGCFVKTPEMEGFAGSYEDVSDPELAEDVAAYVEAQNVPSCATAENKEGKASFTGLELGLYLVVQTEASDGYEPLKPFLVSVPMNENGRYVYEVNAEGKFQLSQAPKPTTPATPTTPANPAGPTLPQTGQLNWPVPVLAALGLALFAAGWALRFGKRQEQR